MGRMVVLLYSSLSYLISDKSNLIAFSTSLTGNVHYCQEMSDHVHNCHKISLLNYLQFVNLKLSIT